MFIHISCKCDTNRAGYFTLDAHASSRLFRRTSKKISKPRVTDLCEGNPLVTGGFPSQRASNANNVSVWSMTSSWAIAIQWAFQSFQHKVLFLGYYPFPFQGYWNTVTWWAHQVQCWIMFKWLSLMPYYLGISYDVDQSSWAVIERLIEWGW